MALSRDQQRLIKMDVEILELRYLYEREVMKEIELNKHNLLLSRGFKHRLDKTVKARAILANSMKDRMSSKASFAITYAERKLAMDEAQMQVDQIMKTLANKFQDIKTASALKFDTSLMQYELKVLTKDLNGARTVLRNKERALVNWEASGELHARMQSHDKIPKDYEVEKDVDAIYGSMPNNEIMNLIKMRAEGIDLSAPKAVNTTTLDMLMRPEEKAAMDALDSIPISLEDNIVELSVEEQEIREMEKMHSTQYKPVEI